MSDLIHNRPNLEKEQKIDPLKSYPAKLVELHISQETREKSKVILSTISQRNLYIPNRFKTK